MSMKYVAAYLMSVLSGNESPSAEEVTTILESVGVNVENDVLKAFLKYVQGKTTHELIAQGMMKLQSVPSGGAVMASGGGGGGGADAPAAAAADTKEDEKKEDEEEEEDDMGFSLFD